MTPEQKQAIIETYKMKRGDYRIKIRVFEAQELAGENIDPVCKIYVLD